MSAEALVSRLEKPKKTGPDSWICRCPAHADKSPSMTIRELDDGRVLVHCFAGCDVAQILGAVGLDFDALFSPKLVAERLPPIRRPFPAADVLEAVAHDALVVQQVAIRVQESGELRQSDRVMLSGAVGRIAAARDLANG